jgi:FkbM family methyltransferase
MVLPVMKGAHMQGLAHMISNDITQFNEGERICVLQRKIDDLEMLQGIKIDAIKIDVENFEYPVFKGEEQLLKHNKPIIYCELWDNENRMRCFDLLQSLDLMY